MNRLTELLRDSRFIAELFNGPCVPRSPDGEYAPLNAEWIDEAASDAVTEAFSRLMPEGMPYLTRIVVEKNPDTLHGGACVDENAKRTRYFVLTAIPETEYPFDLSFPLIQQMRLICLIAWETVRAALTAARADLRVVLANEPEPPILNNARLEWASVYLGKKPYVGIMRLVDQCRDGDAPDIGGDFDVHLFKAREMAPDPFIDRLIAAYDADRPDAKEE